MAEHVRRTSSRPVVVVACGALILMMAGMAILVVRASREGPFFLLGIADRRMRNQYTPENYQATRERASAIIAGLEAYKVVHGEFPAGLEALVPDYVSTIEPPLVGDAVWQYTPKDDGFTIQFFVGPIYEGDSYDSRTGDWHVDR